MISLVLILLIINEKSFLKWISRKNQNTLYFLHLIDILNDLLLTGFTAVICSSSGVTDILVLVIVTILADIERVFYDGSNNLNQEGRWLNDLQPKNDLKEALTGFHAFTGNDSIPTFFRKGKKKFYDEMFRNPKFMDCFQNLGASWSLLPDIVCKLYGSTLKTVN